MRWTVKGIEQGNQRRLRIGLALTFFLGALAFGIQILDFTRLGFSVDFHAYGSLFYILGGFAFVILSGGLIMNLLIQFWAGRGEYNSRNHVGVENTGLYWYAAIVVWLLTFAALYGVPYLT